MQRVRAVLALLIVVAASAPPAEAGSQEDPELTDDAGDQAITGPFTQLPGVPLANDETFDDIDIVAAWFGERTNDCISEPEDECPALTLVVQTAAGWSGGTLQATFQVERGPTSYAHSNATGREVTVTVQGTTVTGLDNASAEVGPDGLRVKLPIARLGAVGGDRITNLTLATSRTDAGPVTDASVTQDDSSATDEAGPGADYMMLRPPPAPRIDLHVLRTGNATGNAATLAARGSVEVELRVSNLGTDDDAFTLAVASDPPLRDPPVLAAVQTPVARGDSATVTVPVSLEGMAPGTIRVTFSATTGRGATDSAVVVLVLDLPQAARSVVPAGLDFLTPAAEAAGLDDAFGRFGELVLLALIVLLAILAVFLLVAPAPSTLASAAAPEAPAMKGPDTAPAGVLAPAVPPAAPAREERPAKAPPAAATVGGALAIESIEHDPQEPEEGQDVQSIVTLRNPGPTRQVRVVLSLDDADVDEKAATLPARATKTVRLGWTAGAGENRVRVRVLPA